MRIAFAVSRLAGAVGLAATLAEPLHAQQGRPLPGTGAEPSACVQATGPDTTSTADGRTSVVQSRDTAHAALRILASVTADEVRFVGTPRICVRLTGDARLDSVHVLARRNLASPVVSNTTYRNIYVAVEILGRLNADCIAGRITGAAADTARTARCAELGVQTGTGPRAPAP